MINLGLLFLIKKMHVKNLPNNEEANELLNKFRDYARFCWILNFVLK